MNYKQAKEIIESEFGDLQREDKNQFDTLVSLLIKYGADYKQAEIKKKLKSEIDDHTKTV